MNPSQFFDTYKKNVFSQNGEDGVLEEILRRLSIDTKMSVVEFGAWDGIHLSNTFNLIKNNRVQQAVLIEGEQSKMKDLRATAVKHPCIQPVCAFVDYTEGSKFSLDSILKTSKISKDFDVLSIDVDSSDYNVWKACVQFQPKIVIIEINSSVRPEVKGYIHTDSRGTSFQPTLELGVQKGYSFVCHTGNMIFIRNDLYSKLGFSKNIDPQNHFRTNWL